MTSTIYYFLENHTLTQTSMPFDPKIHEWESELEVDGRTEKTFKMKEIDDLSPLRCIDCDEDVRTKKAVWGCEVCGLNTCEECCENDYGYVMCAGCVREKQEKKPKNKKKRKKLVIIY